MRVTIRDLISVVAIAGLLACWRVAHLKAELMGELAAARQQEVRRANEHEAALATAIDQLTARLDEYENQQVLMRRLLLMPTKLIP